MESEDSRIARKLQLSEFSLAAGYILLSLWLYTSSGALNLSMAFPLIILALTGIVVKTFRLIRLSRLFELAGSGALIALWVVYLGVVFTRGFLELRLLEASLSLVYLTFLVLSSNSLFHVRTSGSSLIRGADPHLRTFFNKAVSRVVTNGIISLLYNSFITASVVAVGYVVPLLSPEYDISLPVLAVSITVFFILSNSLLKS